MKGTILFFSLGLLYFLFTLSIEFFLWLKPVYRTFLFWLFVVVEVVLLSKFIAIPLVKLVGLKKGLSQNEAAKIIGNHFPEVKDKLLNVIQLKKFHEHTELIEASIQQKSIELKPIPFKNAVQFSTNKKYIKYAVLPIILYLFIWITGNYNVFNQSFNRVVKYNTQFEPPAPFQFKITNNKLEVIEGKPFELFIETVGNIVPNEAKIYFGEEKYYLNKIDIGKFNFQFENIHNPTTFVLEANGVVSQNYTLSVVNAPLINSLRLVLNYPNYVNKRNEVITNTGNAIVPEGTLINWQITTKNAYSVSFVTQNNSAYFNETSNNYFSYQKQATASFPYQIASSNAKLINYETLNFNIDVIKDKYPTITVETDLNEIMSPPIQFAGQLSDDYGISALYFVIQSNTNPKAIKRIKVPVTKTAVTDFYYEFNQNQLLKERENYTFYFEVYDNDAVNGAKPTRSKKFSFYSNTKLELQDELLKNQQNNIDNFKNTLKSIEKNTHELQNIKNDIQQKTTLNWNDVNQLEQFLKRQQQYQQLINKQATLLDEDLKQQPNLDQTTLKKEELQKRLAELNNFEEQNKLQNELKQLMKQLDKSKLTEKLAEISKKNKRNSKSLERILELTKRYYVEQKATQIQQKLEELAKQQNKNATENNDNTNIEKQRNINEQFKEITKDLDNLNNSNNGLKRPMQFPETKSDENEISNQLNQILNELENSNSNKSTTQKKQKSTSVKMQQLSNKFKRSMQQMQGEEIEENIDDLRKIVENLITFSFEQEDLQTAFSSSTNASASYPNHIKNQQKLKQYFEHIDDSLYVLSLRVVQISSYVQKEVENVHFNIDESLKNFTDNQIGMGIANQQYTITSTNNLADKLSDLLENLLNASAKMGKSSNGNTSGFSLPDVIKKQTELGEKMGEQLKKSGNKNGENLDEEGNEGLYQLYQEQTKLREILEQLLPNNNSKNANAIKQMQEIEQELLNKGYSENLISKIKQLNYQLLKLEEAKLEQGYDNKRKAEENISQFNLRQIREIEFKKKIKNNTEILNRQSLPLRTNYKKRVQEYFKTQEE